MGTPDPTFIEIRVKRAIDRLAKLGYHGVTVSGADFLGWMTADKFAPYKITMDDVLVSDNLMVHEVAEINEIKKHGLVINSRVILDSSREMIYKAHIIALELELEYLMMVYESRFKFLKQVVFRDEYTPESMKTRAKELISKLKKN